MKVTFRNIQLLLIVLLIPLPFLAGCTAHLPAGTKAGDWPYRPQAIQDQKIFMHNPTNGLLIDYKEKKILQLFKSDKVNATRVQGSTTVIPDISPDFSKVVFRFAGMDMDLIDRNKADDQVRFYPVASGKMKTLLDKGGYGAASCWSPDSKMYIFSSRLESIFIYDTEKDKLLPVKKPEGTQISQLAYVHNKYLLANSPNRLYLYSGNSWSTLANNLESVLRQNSAGNCYLVNNQKVYKVRPDTKEVLPVYSIPDKAQEMRTANSKDLAIFYKDTRLYVYDTVKEKEQIFLLKDNLSDIYNCYISPGGDKLLLASYGDHTVIVSTPEGSTFYEFDKTPRVALDALGWYDNDSLVIVDGLDIKDSKIFSLKTQTLTDLLSP